MRKLKVISKEEWNNRDRICFEINCQECPFFKGTRKGGYYSQFGGVNDCFKHHKKVYQNELEKKEVIDYVLGENK